MCMCAPNVIVPGPQARVVALYGTMGCFYFGAYVFLALCVLRNQGNL